MMDDDEESRPRTFCVMWDCNGLEAIGEVADPALKTWAVLANKPVPKNNFNVMHWEMRAQYNPQRHYEIYAIGVDSSITQEDIRDMFETDPQYAADLIRARGERIYGHRRTQKDAII
jgi:hypothetical protein